MDNEKEINEAYNKLLTTINSNGDTDFNNIIDRYDENFVSELSKDNDLDSSPQTVTASYNPETGDITVSDSSDSIDTDKQFESFAKKDEDGSITLDAGVFDKVLLNDQVSDMQDAIVLARLVSRRLNGENFDPYPEFPQKYKMMVNNLMLNLDYSQIKPNMRSRSFIAKKVLDEIVNEYKKEKESSDLMDLDNMLAGFNKKLGDSYNETALELSKVFVTSDEERREQIESAIQKCKDEGKTEGLEKLIKIRDMLDEVKSLDKFSEFCNNCKIKRYDLENYKRIFSNFNYKYEKHKNTINDINYCPVILGRHLTQYSENQRIALCIAFCKYCMNMSPDNIEEHTFMYYFIRNIIAIDRVNPKGKLYIALKDKEKEFYDLHISSLCKCIDNLKKRNVTLN